MANFNVAIDNLEGFPIITLTNTLTGSNAEIYSKGGLLNAFHVPLNGKLFNAIDGFANRQDTIDNITKGFKSAKLSPFVCRMQNGKYTFQGEQYQIHKFYLQEHAIHGLLYDAAYSIDYYEASDERAMIRLGHTYQGSDPGYPFPYDIAITWQLEKDDCLTVTTEVSHKNAHAIPIADGWHPYFTIGGEVDDWHLQFTSEAQLEYDQDLLPTGRNIKDTRFLEGCLLKDIKLDNAFELDNSTETPVCILKNNYLSLSIKPDRHYPILQIYIPDHRKSIAIENLSGAPDNFNNGIGLILLEPNEIRSFSTVYQLSLVK